MLLKLSVRLFKKNAGVDLKSAAASDLMAPDAKVTLPAVVASQ